MTVLFSFRIYSCYGCRVGVGADHTILMTLLLRSNALR
jgi:hypothetical protein